MRRAMAKADSDGCFDRRVLHLGELLKTKWDFASESGAGIKMSGDLRHHDSESWLMMRPCSGVERVDGLRVICTQQADAYGAQTSGGSDRDV